MEEMQKITSYKSHSILWKVGIVFFIILLASGSYVFFTRTKDKENFRYVTQLLHKGDLTITVSATGYIEPLESVEIGTEVSGTIEEVYVDYNDPVKKGQRLARLDKTKYKSALDQAEASLNAAKASLENMRAQFYQADATLSRNKMLRKSTQGSLPSQSDWDRDWANYGVAKAQVSNAKAQVTLAQHALTSAQYDLQKTTIYSPMDGVILVRNVDPGQTVAASFQTPVLFKIAKDLTKMELQASIDEADIAKVKAGQIATFTVDAYPEKTFEAHIRLVRVNSELVEGVVTYKAVMSIDNSSLLLKPGMSIDADIITEAIEDTFVLPKSALLFTPVKPKTKSLFRSREKDRTGIDPKPHVWILEHEVPKKVYVRLLGSSGSDSAISSEELQEGDPLIVMQEKVQ